MVSLPPLGLEPSMFLHSCEEGRVDWFSPESVQWFMICPLMQASGIWGRFLGGRWGGIPLEALELKRRTFSGTDEGI